jgi:ribosomal-protein-alanine N-acetyltransferase
MELHAAGAMLIRPRDVARKYYSRPNLMKNSRLRLCKDEILLRLWRPEDARWYVESRDEEVFRWTTESPDLTVAEAEQSIKQAGDRDDLLGFAITERHSGKILGNITLALEEKGRQGGEVMYWLAPRARGQGIASKALKILCRWAFNRFKLERITLKTHVDNLKSQSVAKRAGFQPMEAADDKHGGTDNGAVEKAGSTAIVYGRCPHLPVYINDLGFDENICRSFFEVFQQPHNVWYILTHH